MTPVCQSIPRGAILNAWSESQWTGGIQIESMKELTTFAVRTFGSLYEITVLDGMAGEVLVRGGAFFPERGVATLNGSTFGGSILKWRGVYPGLRLEFIPRPVEFFTETVFDPATGQTEVRAGHKVIRTSPVQSIEIVG